jgi:succinoglycan biosynthesis protein ExoA
MTVTLIIPVKPDGEVKALARLRALGYPCEGVEVIVAEGTNPSRQRNLAAGAAAGEILYFLDDDSIPQPGFIERALRHFGEGSVAAAGGPSVTPPEDSLRQRAFAAVFTSPAGGGGVRNRYRRSGSARRTDDSELILCNLAFRRDAFLGAGGLDVRLYPNEENELMDRLLAQGWHLVHDPELAVFRSQRRTIRAFARQLFRYGRGRGMQTRFSGKVNPASLVPPLFLLYLVSLCFLRGDVYSIPLLCYVLLILLSSAAAAVSARCAAVGTLLPVLFPLFHLGYGAGMLSGLLFPKPVSEGCEVRLRTISAAPEGAAGEGISP